MAFLGVLAAGSIFDFVRHELYEGKAWKQPCRMDMFGKCDKGLTCVRKWDSAGEDICVPPMTVTDKTQETYHWEKPRDKYVCIPQVGVGGLG
jgi:hypothetical protein